MPEELTPSDIATVLRRLRKGDKALLDKKKALADLGYGNVKNVEGELKKANNYRGVRGLPPLDIDEKNVHLQDRTYKTLVAKPDFSSIEVLDDVEDEGAAYIGIEGDPSYRGQLRLSPDKSEPEEYDSRVNALLKGDVFTPEETLGHELTHSMTRSEFPLFDKLGKEEPRKSLVKAPEISRQETTYPELNPREFAPPLAALTRLEYQKTGERIDTPEKFDKKIAEYDAMSSKEKLAFRKKLPVEVSRFYGYLDTVSDPKAEDISLYGPEDDETPPVRYAGKNTMQHTGYRLRPDGSRGSNYNFVKRDIDAGLRVFGIDLDDYDDMTPKQRDYIKKTLGDYKYGPNVPPHRKTRNIAARRLDSYDKIQKTIGMGYHKENYVDKHSLKGGEEAPIKIKGKDRRKRFLDISREMIPSLVEKEDSFEEAVNRRMS